MNMKQCSYALLALLFSGAAMAADALSDGQVLYLPVYSHIWYGDRTGNIKHPEKTLLSVLVSIRNTSLKMPIRILSARYFSTEGKLLNEYLAHPTTINAMGTLELFVERKELKGGSGANFVIQWDAVSPTNPPLVEAVHVDIREGSRALTFMTSAHPIQADK
jgi:hypothetical protein